MALMYVAYVLSVFHFSFAVAFFYCLFIQLIKHKFLFIEFLSLFNIHEYMGIVTFHILSVWKFYILKIQGGNGLFWIFWPFLVFSTVRYIRIAGKQTDWEHRDVKEHRKRKNKSHLGKFFDSFSNLNHVRKSKHPREENGNCYLVRHKTSLKQFKIKV